MPLLQEIKHALLHLAFPHVCAGCAVALPDPAHCLCLKCLSSLPETTFPLHADNPVEKMFWGRLPLQAAAAQYYFSKESLTQQLIHELKYRSNKEVGSYLGTLMGQALLDSGRFDSIEAIIPLPLHRSKQFRRGYNQATLLCQSIGSIMKKPLMEHAVIRTEPTESQTNKGRVARWENMEGKFAVQQPESIRGKHVLLVDDVITTGATLEACGRKIIEAGAELSIATLCFSTH